MSLNEDLIKKLSEKYPGHTFSSDTVFEDFEVKKFFIIDGERTKINADVEEALDLLALHGLDDALSELEAIITEEVGKYIFHRGQHAS
jgi:hypothetical protein